MSFLLTNFFLLFFHYLWISLRFSYSLRHRLISALLFFITQLIFVPLVLGLAAQLYLSFVIAAHVAVPLFLLLIVFLQKKKIRGDVGVFLSNDGRVIKGFIKNFFFFENFAILSIFLLAVLWIATAVFLLPNRDVDGLCYHLPQIYESILQHRWLMLPLELRSHFAFPFNAELLFLWPAIFFHSQQFVDGVQGVMALFGVCVLYALGRELKLTARTSVFIAFLFFLSPVVLAQVGSNYIDLIIAVLFLFAVYFAVSFYKTNSRYDLYNAAMAIGLLVGTKYAMLVLVVSLQVFMIKGLRKMSRIHLGCYIAVIVLLGGYWYLRNWVMLGNPIFPVTLGSDGVGATSNSISECVSTFGEKCRQLFFADIGIGTFNGGMGLVFWGMGLPSWLIYFLRSLKDFNHGQKFSLYLWLQVLIGFLFLFFVRLDQLLFDVRYIIFIIPIVFLALGKIIEELPKIFHRWIHGICIISVLLSVTSLSINIWPRYDCGEALFDRHNHRFISEYKYLDSSVLLMNQRMEVYYLLDTLTVGKEGFHVYMASDIGNFWVTHMYGRRLQNRIVNFDPSSGDKPDAVIFQKFDKDQPLFFVGPKILPEQMMSDQEYALLMQSETMMFFVKKARLEKTFTKQ